MALDAAGRALHALFSDPPQQLLALKAVGGRQGRPRVELVRLALRDRIDQCLKQWTQGEPRKLTITLLINYNIHILNACFFY